MATKREPPVNKKVKQKTPATDAPQVGDAPPVLRKATKIKAKVRVDDDPEIRRRLIAMEAYYLAERRGFTPGHEVEDWIAAEAVILSRGSSDATR